MVERNLFSVVGAGVLLGSLVAPGDALAGASGNLASDRAVEIQRFIDLEMRWSGIPGIAVAVVENGVLVHKYVEGLANVELSAPLTTATVFQLSSTAKAFTGVAAVMPRGAKIAG
jgi:CubicO group peptidase (beta-lactamase class C family)